MIEQFTQYPIGFFTTVQPFLFLWVLAISFFITVSLVALLVKEKTWKEITALSVGLFFVVSIIATIVSTWVVGVDVINTEVIWVKPVVMEDDEP